MKFSIFNFKFSKKAGFTLLELVVSIGLFGIAVSISIGALISLFDANRKSETLSSAISNLNYTVESMTRNIRFGSAFHCGSGGNLSAYQPCVNGDTFLAITANSQVVVYNFTGTAIQRSDDGGLTYKDITGADVTIQSLSFFVDNTTPFSLGDYKQPYVRIVIRGYSGLKPSSRTSFNISTLVSQRSLDL